ncbi:ATP synthase F1 subunit gamma [Psychroflexus sediminis]|uniref:ATP synthase gamma chain n=1 Tax=Psychroflexus sediminis TaxID=470826 RepID=A0A1G7X5G8_9FLAO|nr:ATP synthase F1 subunit gamma [Psychroflexus sediminis]SDG79449.1 ATP synthase F1 subcomplex gamma subunit [Psychroflexus sediminis]
MANLKELRSRISSVSSTMQITSAMKMVSAAKLNRAQNAIEDMRPYAEKLTELLQSLSASLDDNTNSPYSEQNDVDKVLVIAISSNRGLAGAFNTNIVKRVRSLMQETHSNKTVDIICIGKKAGDVLRKSNDIKESYNKIYDDLTYDDVAEIAEHLMDLFKSGKYNKIELVYNSFKNAATQIVTTEQFLPIKSPEKIEGEAISSDYIFEPNKAGIVKDLIPKALKIQLFKAIRDSVASEHGARMTAMHKATDNATELRDDLKLSYNKARQASITNEILEIVAGAEALADS